MNQETKGKGKEREKVVTKAESHPLLPNSLPGTPSPPRSNAPFACLHLGAPNFPTIWCDNHVQREKQQKTGHEVLVSVVTAAGGWAGYAGGRPPVSKSRSSEPSSPVSSRLLACRSCMAGGFFESYGGGASPSSFKPSTDRVSDHGDHLRPRLYLM
ncbi:hypothetical protein J3459_006221 [Metarhizium acridum]|nr:hypothetical protein J3459_006221 [Metarhizium acridum]